jgi:ACS family hexuronate transporter-like MFS transporter
MPGLRWWIAGLLMLATVVNYLDRQSLSVAQVVIQDDFQIGEQEYSWIVAGFTIAYLLTQPLAGRLLDWLGTRVGFIVSVGWWSAASMLHALAGGWGSMAACRFLLGVGEAGSFPGAAKTVGEWFPPRERTLATGIYNSGASIGAMVAPPVVGAIILWWNWRLAFVLTGAIGFLWVILWAIFYRPVAQHPWLRPKERALIEGGRQELAVAEPPPGRGAWRVVLSQRNFWGIALARFLSEPAWQFFTYFIPLYMKTEHGWHLKDVALFAWVPFLASDLGCLFGGALPPLFQKLGLKLLTARKASATVAGLIMLTAVFVAKAPSAGWAIFFISVAAFAHQTMSSTVLTLPADLFPKRTVGTAFGLAGSVGYAGGTLFVLIVGVVAGKFGYGPLFTTIAFLDLIGAALIWTLIRAPRPEEPAAAIG